MGPMAQGFNRRKVVKLAAFGVVALFTWSLIAAPSSSGDAAAPPVEPSDLSAYYTFADSVPVAGFADTEVGGLPAFGPGIAHGFTEVGLPSSASADGFLTDFGIANTVNGTTTGTFVPTEASAKQPGGDPQAGFNTAGGPIGNDQFARAAAGVVRATAIQSDAPQANTTAYLGNVYVLPGTGSPPEPPGTYDPTATFPGGKNGAPTPDPGPHEQTAILSIGSVASNTQSIREASTVTSFGVAELHNVAIGNRTAENVCAHCFTIDDIRVEAFAQTNGQPGGSRAAYRVFIGRACYRSQTTAPPAPLPDTTHGDVHEADQCLGTTNPGGEDALTQVDTSKLNDLFAKPLILSGVKCPGSNAACTLAIRVHVGTTYVDPSRLSRSSNPPEDACRNYAYPDPNPKAKKIADCEANGSKTGPDRDQGQEAKAVAEGINIDMLTFTGTQLIPANASLDACFDNALPDAVKSQSAYQAVHSQVGCPIPAVRQVRDINLTLGAAVANAVARPAFSLGGGGGGGGGTTGSIVPPVSIPPIGGGGTSGGTVGGGSSGTVGGGSGGLGGGPYAMKIDWSSLSIKPWKAKDLAKGIFAGGIIVGMVVLIRRRLKLGGAG